MINFLQFLMLSNHACDLLVEEFDLFNEEQIIPRSDVMLIKFFIDAFMFYVIILLDIDMDFSITVIIFIVKIEFAVLLCFIKVFNATVWAIQINYPNELFESFVVQLDFMWPFSVLQSSNLLSNIH